jgi:hypothetical protein
MPWTVFIGWTTPSKVAILLRAQLSAMVAQSTDQSEDATWYADSGANHYLTPDLETLQLPAPYTGTDSNAVGNGSGLQITHTGSSVFHTPHHILHMRLIFRCPQALANLLSINQFCKDNDCFFILAGSHFFIKDNQTGLNLLDGKSEGGLYPIRTSLASLNKAWIHTTLFGG